MALVALNCLNLIQDNFVRLYCNSCHISVHLKNTYHMGEFLYSHFNIEGGRKYTIFLADFALLFQEQ